MSTSPQPKKSTSNTTPLDNITDIRAVIAPLPRSSKRDSVRVLSSGELFSGFAGDQVEFSLFEPCELALDVSHDGVAHLGKPRNTCELWMRELDFFPQVE